MWFPYGGRAIGFALVFTFAVEHAAECGSPAGALYCTRRIQVHQVIVRLAHARLLPLVTPPKEKPRTFLQEAA